MLCVKLLTYMFTALWVLLFLLAKGKEDDRRSGQIGLATDCQSTYRSWCVTYAAHTIHDKYPYCSTSKPQHFLLAETDVTTRIGCHKSSALITKAELNGFISK